MGKTVAYLSFWLLWVEAAGAEQEAPHEAATELDTVTITASRTERSMLDLPGTASTIDSETLERRLLRTIKDVVRYEPGVYVQNDPQRFGTSGFNIRGIGGNRVQMLVDGVRIPDSFSIGSFQSARRNMVDIDALRAVEIVRGPGSAMYGSDGIGGVVSFVTKDPQDYLEMFGRNHYQGLKLLYSTANDGFVQTATLAGRLNRLEGLLLLTHGEGAETDNQGRNGSRSSARTEPNPQDTRNLNLLSKLLYRFSDDNLLRLTGEATEDQVHTDARHLYGLNYAGRDVYRFLTHDRQARWRVSLDHAVKGLGWLDSLNWRLYGQRSRTRQNVDEARTSLQGEDQAVGRRFRYDQDMVGGEIQGSSGFDWLSTSHRMVFGAEAFRTGIAELRDGFLVDLRTAAATNEVTPDAFPVRDFPLSSSIRAGVYWQDEIGLFDRRVELLPAGRFDYFGLRPEVDPLYAKDNKGNQPIRQDETAFSPKFGALFHLTDSITLHGQYAEGFRAPNFSDANSGFVNFAFGYAAIPNPNLKPETSSGGEVGLRFQGDAGYADATVFRNDYQGFIRTVTACNPATAAGGCPPFNLLTFMTVNTPDPVRIQGFEFKGELRLAPIAPLFDGLRLLASYSYSEGRNLADRRPINEINPMRGVLGLRYDAPGGDWGSEAMLTLAAPKRARDIDFASAGAVFPTAGYALVDLTAYYRYGDHATLTAGLFNLLDKTYIEWEDARSRGTDPHAGLGGAADIRDRYTRPGRNAGVSLNLEF
jgi:hemoglobin/transferrin/lactoferrin receptor protein